SSASPGPAASACPPCARLSSAEWDADPVVGAREGRWHDLDEALSNRPVDSIVTPEAGAPRQDQGRHSEDPLLVVGALPLRDERALPTRVRARGEDRPGIETDRLR